MSSVQFSIRPAHQELYKHIKEFLLESETLYPGIGKWWESRVVPQIQSGLRVCNAAIVQGNLVAVSIGKLAKESAKLCTLRVRESHGGLGIGHELLQRTLKDLLAGGCRRVHFTISEKILSECGDFFTPYGFSMVSWTKGRYVAGMDELAFSVDSLRLRKHLQIEPIIRDRRQFVLLSIKPKYAQLIEQGQKLVEFRRKFSACLAASKAIIYVSSPTKELRLTATIASVVRSTPRQLWERFSHLGGVDRQSFNNYFTGIAEGYALLLSDVRVLPNPLPLDSPFLREARFQPPQSFSILREDSPILNAISVLGT
jgi:predicted transcriptional regulator/predicted N-acetyltransferase YhbS